VTDDLSALERLIALAGTTKVEAHKRTTKSGKVVDVHTYTRSVGSMSNMDLYKHYQDLSAGKGPAEWEGPLKQQQVKNRLQQTTNEIRQRQQRGEWGHSDKGAATRAKNKVDKEKGALDRGRQDARARFEENKANPKPKIERVKKYETGEVDEEGKPKTEPIRDKDGKEVETEEYKAEVQRVLDTLAEVFGDKERGIPADPKKIREYDTQQKHGIFEQVKTADGKVKQKFVAYTPERTEQHRKILTDILDANSHVPTDRKAVMSGGLGGAGKGFILKKYAGIDKNQYLTIDPDEMKQELLKRGMGPDVDGLLPMEQAAFIHEESSDLANMLHDIAMARGMNVILDTTMAAKGDSGTESSVDGKIAKFKSQGYEVHGVFVDVSVETSIGSALDRHLGGVNRFNAGEEQDGGDLGGRYVPPSYIEKSRPAEGSEFRSRNREVFERLVAQGLLDGSEVWDNDDRTPGSEPKLLARSLPKSKDKKDASKTSKEAIDALKAKTGKKDAKVALSALELLAIKLTSVK